MAVDAQAGCDRGFGGLCDALSTMDPGRRSCRSHLDECPCASGIVTRRDRLLPEEHQSVAGMNVTTPERTAFDLGRLMRGDDDEIARHDALGNATRFDRQAVADLAARHGRTPGLPQLRSILDVHDPGAESPRETWLRLLLIRAGFPRPRTQIPVVDDFGDPRYFLDMGWEEIMIAVGYDGDHHRKRPRFGNDIVRSEFIAYRGWTHIRVVAGAGRHRQPRSAGVAF